MKTSILNPGKSFAFKEVDLPDIEDEEVLLKVNSCAICGSDLKIAKFGNKRITEERTIGHEISGTIESIGKNVKGFKMGDKVSVGADLPCHDCNYCKNGNVNLCETNYAIGYQFDGGFAEYIVLNKYVLKNGPIKKFYNVSFEEACLGEPLACAINGVRKSINCYADEHPENALIFGGGPMGLLLAEYLSFIKIKQIYIAETNSKRIDFINNNTNFKAFDPSELNDEFYNLIFTSYIFIFCSYFFVLSFFFHLKIILFLVLITCVASDIGGFVFGKIFKGPKLTTISPNKTISGALGSLIFSSLVISTLFYLADKTFDPYIIVIGCIISISCQLGDLFFSFLKRKSSLKDSGNFLPGHGGILDRCDGLLLGVPLGFLILLLSY